MIIGLMAVLITMLLLFLWQDRYYKRWDIFTIKPSSLILQFILILGMAEMLSAIIIAFIHPDSAHLKTGLLSDLIVMITITLPFLYLRIIKPLAEQQKLNIHTLTDNIPDSIIVLDKNGIITYCNPATETIYGYTPDELKGQHVMVLMDETGKEDFYADMRNKQLSTPFRINRQISGKRKDGSILTAHLTANGIRLNNNFFIVGIIKDITDLQNVSDELRKASAFLNAILENIPIAVFAKNASDHRFLFWNKYSEKFFGLKKENVLGKNDYDFFPKEQADFFWQKDNETMERGEIVDIPEEPITLSDGTTLTLHTTKIPAKNENLLLAVSEDITERKKAEEMQEKLIRIIKAVNAINMLITKETDAAALLRQTCRILIDTRDYDIVAIRLKEPNFHKITSIVSDRSENLKLDISECLDYMDKHIVDYLSKGKAETELSTNELFNAVCSIPMVDNGQLRGTLFICSHEEIKFDTEEINMLRELANDISFALHHIEDMVKKGFIEKDLHETASRLMEAQKIARIGNWEWDIRKNFIQRGDEVLEMFDVTPEQVGTTFEEFIAMVHPDDRTEVMSKLNEAINKGSDYSGAIEHRMLLPDDRVVYVSERAKVHFDDAGKPLKVVGIIQDITERVLMEEKLRENEDRFRRVAGYAQDAIIIMDNNDKITYWNKAAERIFGYTKDEMVGKDMHTTLAPPSYYEAYHKGIEYFNKTGEGPVIGKTLELTALRKNGEEFPIELSTSTIKVKGKWHAVGILRDITDKKKTEQELIKAKEAAEAASKAKTEFLTNMSHEIRTPMNSMLGMDDLLLDTQLTEEQRNYIDISKKSGEHLIKLINDILDLSKLEEGRIGLHISDFDLNDILHDIEIMMSYESAKKGLTLSIDVDGQVPRHLRGDPDKLGRVIMNIVGNAVKFTEKGDISVNVSLSPDVAAKPDETELIFSIKDTGIGIQKDKMEFIFERFYQIDASITRQHGGTGLGLVISKKLIELMNGRIWVESEVGKGSTFYFTLKLGIAQADKQQIPEKSATEQKETKEEKYDLLLVEDSEDNRQLIELYLKKLPYNIDTAENGAIAVDKAKQKRYDIILMDIQMPVMDGYAATKAIREHEERSELPATPILALTANAFKEDEEKSYAAGCNGYLAKPIKKGILFEMMAKYMKTVHK